MASFGRIGYIFHAGGQFFKREISGAMNKKNLCMVVL
jgi:hypothetical protein